MQNKNKKRLSRSIKSREKEKKMKMYNFLVIFVKSTIDPLTDKESITKEEFRMENPDESYPLIMISDDMKHISEGQNPEKGKEGFYYIIESVKEDGYKN